MNTAKLKVIIADSSNYSRLVLANMVQEQPDLEVLDTASDGASLIEALRQHRPDVVLADLAGMSTGARARLLRRLHQETGVPVLAVLDQQNGAAATFKDANEFGVYDYVFKPAHKLQPSLRSLQVEILNKIRAARRSVVAPGFSFQNATVLPLKSKRAAAEPKGLIVIGASTGGAQAIEKIVASLDTSLEACVLVALHLPAGFTASFAKRLQALTPLNVVEAKPGTRLQKGKIIIAPGGKNTLLLPGFNSLSEARLTFTAAAPDEFNQPSVDVLMRSAALCGGNNLLGVVLTGMGMDGTDGLRAIQHSGGTTLAQDQESSAIFGMARSAIDKGCVKYVRPLNRIADFINRFVAELPALEPAF